MNTNMTELLYDYLKSLQPCALDESNTGMVNIRNTMKSIQSIGY